MLKKGTRRKVILRRRSPGYEIFVYYARRFGKVLLFLILMVWLGAWFVVADGVEKTRAWSMEKTMETTAGMGFEVRNILVEGRINSDPDIIKAIVNMKKGDPIFAFDPDSARDMIERISWVKTARVERRLPDTIFIELKERIPLALWQKDSGQVLVDSDGEILTDQNISSFGKLIVIEGEDAPEHAADLISLVSAEPELKERVERAGRISGRRWNLQLGNKIEIFLPEKDAGLALRRLMSAHEEGSILEKDIVNIDLRNPDRIIVRPRRGKSHTLRAGTGERI